MREQGKTQGDQGPSVSDWAQRDVQRTRLGISSILELVSDARDGRMCILTTDTSEESQGDLVIPAAFATPAAINFMARHARGLICLAITQDRARKLGLQLIPHTDVCRNAMNFTVSVEAKEGITTGISVFDRARTIAIAIDPKAAASDLVSPGHVFPVVAADGGTLIRADQAEAAVDLARLAGVSAAGVICRIMNDDGTIARLSDLLALARAHRLKIGLIADLAAHRLATEQRIVRIHESTLRDDESNEWRLILYATTIDYAEHLVLTMGDVMRAHSVPVRVPTADLVDQLLCSGRASALRGAMQTIAARGYGVIVVARDLRPTAASERLARGAAAPRPQEYATIVSKILADLGVQSAPRLYDTHDEIPVLEPNGSHGLKPHRARHLAPATEGAAAPSVFRWQTERADLTDGEWL